jgi:uncharacterized membrane protein AbrB (regulator of aidB expression)
MSSNTISELSLLVALIVGIAAVVVVTLVSGADSLAATGLRDLDIALAGGLLGAKIPRAE